MFSSVQNGVSALGKTHMRSTSLSQKFPQRRLWNGSSVCLTDDDPLSSFAGTLSSASSLHAKVYRKLTRKHRKLTLEKKILLPFLQRIEHANFRSRVRLSTTELSPLPSQSWIRCISLVVSDLSARHLKTLTHSMPWGHLKTTIQSAKFQILKPFCLLFRTSM